MAIQPISSTPPIQPTGGSQPVAGAGRTRPSESFTNVLKDSVEQVDAAQQQSAGAVKDYLAGKTQDVLPVVSSVAKADMSFKLLIGVRNKVIEAYKQTMNIQL